MFPGNHGQPMSGMQAYQQQQAALQQQQQQFPPMMVPVAQQQPGQHAAMQVQRAQVPAQPQQQQQKASIAMQPRPAQPTAAVPPRPVAKPAAPAMAAAAGAGVGGMPLMMSEAVPAAKRKKRKAEAKVVHEQVKHYIPESSLYCALRAEEHRLDSLLQQRRADVADALACPEGVQQRLRIYVFTEHQGQGREGRRAVAAAGDVPAWSLVVHGRVLDPETDALEATSPSAFASAPNHHDASGGNGGGWAPVAALQPQQQAAQQQQSSAAAVLAAQQRAAAAASVAVHPFQWYVKKLTVEVVGDGGGAEPQQQQQHQQPGSSLSSCGPTSLTWRREEHAGPFKDRFTFKRPGSEEVDVRITMELHTGLEMCQLSPWLSAFMGVNQATRGKCLDAIWRYIRDNGLINAANPMQVDADDRLQALLKCGRSLPLTSVGARLEPLLRPPQPVVLDYRIKLDGPSPSHPDAWDLDLWVPLPGPHSPDASVPSFVSRLGKGDRDLEQLDQRLGHLHKRLQELQRRRDFYLAFSTDPGAFIRSVVASSARDLRVARLGGGAGHQFEALDRSSFFQGKWVEDAVLRYLHRRLAGGS